MTGIKISFHTPINRGLLCSNSTMLLLTSMPVIAVPVLSDSLLPDDLPDTDFPDFDDTASAEDFPEKGCKNETSQLKKEE
jgi:hypothetical protein